MPITYRLLEENEWDNVQSAIYEVFGQYLTADSSMVDIAVAEDNGKIVGFWMIQPVIHFEPLGVVPEYRDKVSCKQLFNVLVDNFNLPAFAHSSDEKIGQLLMSLGFAPLGVAFFRMPEN